MDAAPDAVDRHLRVLLEWAADAHGIWSDGVEHLHEIVKPRRVVSLGGAGLDDRVNWFLSCTADPGHPDLGMIRQGAENLAMVPATADECDAA
jgi:hypothetical protein